MSSAVLTGGTKRNSLCNAGSCGGTPIIPVSCACCQRVLVKEEGVPRVLTGPAKKIKLEFDPEPFIKKETPDPCSPALKPTQQENQNGTKRRGGERIVFKEEDVDDGNKSEKGSTFSLPSSDASFNFAQPKANFGQYKRPFNSGFRGGSHYKQPHYYRNNYRNNSNSNAYALNHMHYHNNGHFGAARGGFSNAPMTMMQQTLSQHLNPSSIPPRSPLAIKQSFSPFNAHLKTPPCSPLPPKPSIQYLPFNPSVKSNVTSSVIPDPPRGPNPAASQAGQGWWKSSDWPKKSIDNSTACLSNNGSVEMNVSSSSVPVSKILPPSNADKHRTTTFIGQDHGLHTKRASCFNAGGTPAKNSLTAELAPDGDLFDGEDDRAFADNVVDDKDWIEELALEAVIPVKALCSSCLHTSEPKPEDGDAANADIEILFNSCDIQICSEEGSGISKKSARRKSCVVNNLVEVVDINDLNDDVEDITPDIHETIAKRKLFVKRPCGDSSNTKSLSDNTNIVNLILDEDESSEQVKEIEHSGENDPNLVQPDDHLLEVLDIGEDIVLDKGCGNGGEEEGSCRPRTVKEPSEAEKVQNNNCDDQGAGDETQEAGQLAAAEEGVEHALVVEAGDINMDVGEELTVPSESSTGADTLVDHSAKLSEPENRAVQAALVSNEAWDEVLYEMQEVGDEVEELAVLDIHKDPPAQLKPEEEPRRSKQDRKVRAQGTADQEIEVCDQGTADQEIEVCDQGNGDQEIEVCDLEGEVSHVTRDKCESPDCAEEILVVGVCAEEIQVVGVDATAVVVPNEVLKSNVISTVTDDCEEVASLVVDNNSNGPYLASCQKAIAAKASGLGQLSTPRKLTRSTVSSTPIRLRRSLRPSSLLNSNTSTDDATNVDESMQRTTPMSLGMLPEKSVVASSRRSSRLTKDDPNVLVTSTLTSVDVDRTQSGQLKLDSARKNFLVEDDIAPSAAIKAKLPTLTRAMLKQISQSPCKDHPIIAETSRSALDSVGGIGRVTRRRSIAATPAAVPQRADHSKRNNALVGRGAASAGGPLGAARRGRAMPTRSVVSSPALVSLKNTQLADINQAVLSKNENCDDGEDRGDGMGSDYDLDYEEDLVAPEVTSSKEVNVEESGPDVPVEDDDDVTCLD